jgi:mRNA interferase HigB
VKVVGRQRVEDFCADQPEAAGRMSAWVLEAEKAEWKTPNDIKVRYASASFLAENRVVFNIGGNRFRIVTKVTYSLQIVLIERVGTHEDYDSWNL